MLPTETRSKILREMLQIQISRSNRHLTSLSPRNALRWGYSNAAVVPSVRPCVRGSIRPCKDLVNTIETTLLHISLSNLADMLTVIRG